MLVKEREKLLAAIDYWQNSGYVHPLTCGVDSLHGNLVGEASGEQVFLRCPTCGYTQEYFMKELLLDYYQRDIHKMMKQMKDDDPDHEEPPDTEWIKKGT